MVLATNHGKSLLIAVKEKEQEHAVVQTDRQRAVRGVHGNEEERKRKAKSMP